MLLAGFGMSFFHLTKTISQKQNYKAKQTRLVYLETFPELRTLMELSLCFEFDRWCCLCAESLDLNDTSIMESVC